MNRYAQRVQELGGKPDPETSPVGASEEELAEVERQLGEELPPDYREFLREFGGYDIDVTFRTRGRFLSDYPKVLCEYNARGVDALTPSGELPVQFDSYGYDADTLNFYGVFTGEARSSTNVVHRKTGLVEDYKYFFSAWEDWPEEWLPISSHYNPGFVVLTFKGEKKGRVLHIYDASMDIIGYVADSFDEFMHLIRNHDPDEDD